MKKLFSTILMVVAICFNCLSKTHHSYKLHTNSVEVYVNESQVENSVVVQLHRGLNEILLTNAATDLKTEEIAVFTERTVQLVGLMYEVNLLEKDYFPKSIQSLIDSDNTCYWKGRAMVAKVHAIDSTIEFYKSYIRDLGNQTGFKPKSVNSRLKLATEAIKNLTRQKRISVAKVESIFDIENKLKRRIDDMKLDEIQKPGQILIKLYAQKAIQTTLNVNYKTKLGFWQSNYRIYFGKNDSTATLQFNAEMIQNTGVTWENAELQLIKHNTELDSVIHDIEPNCLRVEKDEVLTQNNADSLSEIKGLSSMVIDFLFNKKAVANGVPWYTKTSFQWEQDADYFTPVSKFALSNTYRLGKSYSIENDNEKHLLHLASTSIPVKLERIIRPSESANAYILARISNINHYGITGGDINAVYDGKECGKTEINNYYRPDYLKFELGRDKDVFVKTENHHVYSNVTASDSFKIRHDSFDITIKNNNKKAIDLTVEDQIPVSNDQDFKVDEIETGGAILDDKKGFLQWEIALKPDETKVLHFSYNIKYPKGKEPEIKVGE